MLRIVPSPDRRQWVIVAEWLGAERVVFGPASIFACCREREALERGGLYSDPPT